MNKVSFDEYVAFLVDEFGPDVLNNNRVICTSYMSIAIPVLFIERYPDIFCPTCAILFSDLPEHILRKHIDVFNSEMMSLKQNLSEDFIREFADKLDWQYLKQNPNLELTEAFYEEFADRFNGA